MKIALAQINTTVGDIDGNKEKIINYIQQAKKEKADIVVFPAYAISGYPPKDLLLSKAFHKKNEEALEEIKKHTKDIGVVIGNPETIDDEDIDDDFLDELDEDSDELFDDEFDDFFEDEEFEGDFDIVTDDNDNFGNELLDSLFEVPHLVNCVFFLYNGEILNKEYDIDLQKNIFFNPKEYFYDAMKEPEAFIFKGKKCLLSIGNLSLSKMVILEKYDAMLDYVIHVDAMVLQDNMEELLFHVKANNVVNLTGAKFVYVNQVGANDSMVLQGKSFVMDGHKDKIKMEELPELEEAFKVMNINHLKVVELFDTDHDTQFIKKALVLGVRDYFQKSGLQKAVVGLSGGIDSAVVAALAVEALGKENVYGVLMPSKFSSTHSVEDAQKLAENLGIDYDIIPIHKMYDSAIETLKPVFKDKPFDVTEENLQARIRSNILMAISNKFGYVLLNTSNKSESAMGYGTLYGDLSGAISVLGDVYKSSVFILADYINKDKEIIPQHTISKPPSAELRPNQKDSDSLPDYGLLDNILHRYIEERKDVEDIIEEGFDAALVKKIIKTVNRFEFKRKQTPPPIVVSKVPFGIGREVPIVGKKDY